MHTRAVLDVASFCQKMEVFEASINDATQFLMLKELVISRWPSVAEVPVDSLPGELSQTKVLSKHDGESSTPGN